MHFTANKTLHHRAAMRHAFKHSTNQACLSKPATGRASKACTKTFKNDSLQEVCTDKTACELQQHMLQMITPKLHTKVLAPNCIGLDSQKMHSNCNDKLHRCTENFKDCLHKTAWSPTTKSCCPSRNGFHVLHESSQDRCRNEPSRLCTRNFTWETCEKLQQYSKNCTRSFTHDAPVCSGDCLQCELHALHCLVPRARGPTETLQHALHFTHTHKQQASSLIVSNSYRTKLHVLKHVQTASFSYIPRHCNDLQTFMPWRTAEGAIETHIHPNTTHLTHTNHTHNT